MEPDDAVVAYLRTHAPGLPTVRFDARAVTSRARTAQRRRWRRIRNSVVIVTAAATAYLTLALAGPVPVPGVGTVSVPGGHTLRAMLAGLVPGRPPGPDRWSSDVDRLDKTVLPVFEKLQLSYYLLEPGPQCRVLEYPRGDFRDGSPECGDVVPFDAQARADFDEVTRAVERSGIAIERIYRAHGVIYIQLPDSSWEYNWEYVYLPYGGTHPTTKWPEDQWTHVRDNWWFYRAHDD